MPNITINLTTKKANFLKKILNTTDVDSIVNKHFEDWISNIVQTKYNNTKTIDEKIDEIITKQ